MISLSGFSFIIFEVCLPAFFVTPSCYLANMRIQLHAVSLVLLLFVTLAVGENKC